MAPRRGRVIVVDFGKGPPGEGPSDSTAVDHSKHARQVARGTAIALIGGVASFVLASVYQVIVARSLGAAGFGLFILALAISNFLAEGSDLGLDYGVLRFGGIARGLGDPGRFRSVLQRSLAGSFLTGASAAVVLAVGSSIVARLFDKPGLEPMLVPLALSVPFTATSEVARASLRAMGKALPSVVSDSFLTHGIRLATAVWVLTSASSPSSVAAAYLVAEAAVLLLTLGMVWRLCPRDGETGPVRGLFRFSVPMSFNRIILFSNNQTEVFVLSLLASTTTLGIFGVGRRLSMLIGSLLASVGILFNPMVADLHNRGRNAELDQLFKTSTRWLFTLGFPVCLVEVLFASSILHIFGREFESGAVALSILAIGQLVNVGTGVVSNLLAMVGRSKLTLINSVAFLVLSIALDFLLIPRWGLAGAAIANSGAVVVINLVRVWQTQRILGVAPYDGRFMRPVVAGLVAAVGARFLPLPELPIMVDLVIRVATLGIAYLCVLAALGIEEVDREVARSAIARFRGRPPPESGGDTTATALEKDAGAARAEEWRTPKELAEPGAEHPSDVPSAFGRR
ncbi:MAG: flippase [Actinomycetota bacterium]|nr:flippase [Actinomycetota bacterium]